jgi:hypothetical protein
MRDLTQGQQRVSPPQDSNTDLINGKGYFARLVNSQAI